MAIVTIPSAQEQKVVLSAHLAISVQEYAARRYKLLSMLAPNSIAIIAGAQEQIRSNDTEYHFRQNSDFFYLTGFNEPDAFLVLSNQGGDAKQFAVLDSNDSLEFNHATKDDPRSACSIMFVRPSDPTAEIWHGRRLGVLKAPQALNIDLAYAIEDISEVLPTLLDGHDHLYFSLGNNADADNIVQEALDVCKQAPKQSMNAPIRIEDVNCLIHAMRLIKSPAELALMQKSADISCDAHTAAMQICRPNMFEYQLEATILHSFAMQGARHAAYNSIVGSGENACILHYTENTDLLKEGDLVLIDAGSEFGGYAADITRTFPINGCFSKPQKDIYELVLATQLACIEAFKPGVTLSEVQKKAVEMITEGLIDLGVLEGDVQSCIDCEAYKAFYMHGLGHYLGLDVHDVGNYKERVLSTQNTIDRPQYIDKPLEIGMVLTVEPGIYISGSAEVPMQYKNIGVRIEDNIVITAEGNRVLTANAVKTVDDIEAVMLAVKQ